jgi:hypothetical protein
MLDQLPRLREGFYLAFHLLKAYFSFPGIGLSRSFHLDRTFQL